MIPNKTGFEQDNKVFSRVFKDLSIAQLLRKSGINKSYGISAYHIFKVLFLLAFHQKNLYQLLHSKRKSDFNSKNTYYRFMANNAFNWRKFTLLLSSKICAYFMKLTRSSRKKVFVIDDTIIDKHRSRSVELLAKVYDHANARFTTGFTMLTLGFSDGFNFVPIDFALLSSAKKKLRKREINPNIDKRTNGYKRRKEALMTKPELVIHLLSNALKHGITADYVLMDTWFANEPLIDKINQLGLDVIAMVKRGKQRYWVDGKQLTLAQLYEKSPKRKGHNVIASANVKTKHGIPVKLVFVKNRSRKKEYLVLISTDLTLENEEIVRLYGHRWSIECFFKTAKQHLKLGTEYSVRDFSAIICSISVVFARFAIMEYIRRNNADFKTVDTLFAKYCDEVSDIDYEFALSELLKILHQLCESHCNAFTELLKTQVNYWLNAQASFIKLLSLNYCWES